MRRLGTILMILGVNIALASIAAAFWRASFESAVEAAEGTSLGEAVSTFVALMFSGSGVIYWLAILAGLWVFWRGKRMRADALRS